MLLGILLLIVILCCGLFLLKTGLHPRRTGTIPHCPQCDYNLTGLSIERCPECGQLLTPDAIVFGTAHRSWRRIAAGVFCLALLIAPGLNMFRSIEWYRLKPTGLVIS